MHIDEFLEFDGKPENHSELPFTIPKDWTQGRTAFGGLSAGILYSRLKREICDDRPLRSITFNFVGPLNAGEAFTFDYSILREGKNATQITGNLRQNGNVALTAIACFSQNRTSKVEVEPNFTNTLEFPKKPNFIPQIPKITPNFLRHVELAVQDGKLPFTGSKNSSMAGWMRFKEKPCRFGDDHIITLIDAWPPTVLQMIRGPAPASTMSWNVEFIHPVSDISPGEWLAYEAKTVRAHGGYANTEAKIWSESGELVALSRQLVAVFD